MTPEYVIEPLAEDALLLRFGTGIDAATNARVHAAAKALQDANLPGITDIAPAYATVLVRFDPLAWLGPGDAGRAHDMFAVKVGDCLGADAASTTDSDGRRNDAQKSAPDPTGRSIDIPVCYGGAHGPDLDAVAAHARLTVAQAVERHADGNYTVAMLGFAPGFPYLLGLDPALEVPRRANPRTRVPAGSIAIGGAQTGIYPRELPGGWNLIGRTPLTLFDPARATPCPLAPGDHVRFHAINAAEFERLAGPDV